MNKSLFSKTQSMPRWVCYCWSLYAREKTISIMSLVRFEASFFKDTFLIIMIRAVGSDLG